MPVGSTIMTAMDDTTPPEFELLTALEAADPRDAPDIADRLADQLSSELDGAIAQGESA